MVNKKITSINLNSIPFQGSCDATRLQMASKQISQALVCNNCEIPFVISDKSETLTNNSSRGIFIAPDDGNVLLNKNDLLILFFKNLDKIVVKNVPPRIHTSQIFASSLRYIIKKSSFKKGDIIFSYNEFIDMIPTYGYNVFTAYMNFFGYNHEDGVIISESFAKEAQAEFIETVFIPIYEYDFFQTIYNENQDPFKFFPGINQKVKNNIVYSCLKPKLSKFSHSSFNLRHHMISLLQSFSLSDLNSFKSGNNTKFSINEVKTQLSNAYVSGIKIHRIKKDTMLIDSKLQKSLEILHTTYMQNCVIDVFNDVNKLLGLDYAKQITKQHLVYTNPIMNISPNNQEFKDVVYLVELELSSEENCKYADKICNRYAGKGVISLILPDELRPFAKISKKPIDFIYNPFGVFSRMNLSQITEIAIAKNVWNCQNEIIKNPEKTALILNELNNNIIKNFNNDIYYNNIKDHIKKIKQSDDFRNLFIENIKKNNLYIEAPCFSEIDIKTILKNSYPPQEPIIIKRKALQYFKDKLKVDISIPNSDVEIPNILCGPSYILRLHKLASENINARDLGPVQGLTGQPLRGRAHHGGSKLGQMEIEAFLSHGIKSVLRETTTVKSDYHEEKENLIESLIKTGKYDLNVNSQKMGKTRQLVNTYLKFLKS